MSTWLERVGRFVRNENMVLDPVVRPIAGGAPVELVRPQYLLSAGGLAVKSSDYIVVRHGWVTLGSALTLTIRYINEMGDLSDSVYSIAASGGVFAEDEFPLFDGILLCASLQTVDAQYAPGTEYAIIGIKSQSLDGTQPFIHLASGYVYKLNPLSWPQWNRESDRSGPGHITEQLTNDPAAGASISISVDADMDIRLLAGLVTLVTDATVATRNVYLEIATGGQNIMRSYASNTQTASQTMIYDLSVGHFGQGATAIVGAIRLSPFAIIKGGSTITITAVNLQAGDNFGALSYQREQWIRSQNF